MADTALFTWQIQPSLHGRYSCLCLADTAVFSWQIQTSLPVRYNCLYLADTIVEGQGLDSELLHPLELLLVEVLQLVQRQNTVTVQVHAPGQIINSQLVK